MQLQLHNQLYVRDGIGHRIYRVPQKLANIKYSLVLWGMLRFKPDVNL
jgi:hypothetical protein